MTNGQKMMFVDAFNSTQKAVHENAVSKGWYESERNMGEAIALMHSELSEALEALREGNPESKKILGFSHAEEEFADVVIRIMDISEAQNYRIGEAIIAKMIFNQTRPYKHGKVF